MARLPIPFIAAALFALFFMNLMANAYPSNQCSNQFELDRQAALERAQDKIAWGRERLAAGDFEPAAWAAESASVMSSTPNRDALLLQAEAYLGLEEPAAANRILERVLVMNGQHDLDAMVLRVRAYVALRQEAEAKMALDKVRMIRGYLLPNEILIGQQLAQ